MKAHLLFEQSGTFKNEFIKLGIPAEDYDIQNEFGQTDHIIDLYAEINSAYEGGVSIFDTFSPEDISFAFFPCIRFEDQMILEMKGLSYGMKTWDSKKKLKYSMRMNTELNYLYSLISKLAIIYLDRGLKLVIENPYSGQHYLHRYWPLEPSWIDKDRTIRGDAFKKPTQYWFIGFEPKHNFVLEPQPLIEEVKTICNVRNKTQRSMIKPEYAERFIKEFIL